MHRIICSCSAEVVGMVAAAYGEEAEVVQQDIRGVHGRYRLEGDVSCERFDDAVSAIQRAGGDHLRTVMLAPIKNYGGP